MYTADWCSEGSPQNCKLEWIELKGTYSASMLVKISGGLETQKSSLANSCPLGWKIFSPQSKQDWITVGKSTSLPRDPHTIVDVTRKVDGCSKCTDYAMNSKVQQQSTWRTIDGTPWWLRDTKYIQPSGNYIARCYLNIQAVSAAGEIQFNDCKTVIHCAFLLLSVFN